MRDVCMDELEWEVEEIQDRTRDDHNWIVQLQEENGDLRYRNNNLYTCIERLEAQVAELLAFRTVLQHGPGNPIVVDDDGDEVEVISDSEGEVVQVELGHLREMMSMEQVGRLILIEEVPGDQEIWEDERNFRRDWVTEDVNPVLTYPKPLEYVEPPQ